MKYYIDAITKKYATFDGRANRTEFWMFVLFNVIIYIVLAVVENLIGLKFSSGTGILSTLYLLALLVPSIAIAVRRLHDIGKSGWWLLIGLVPFVGGIILLVFYCLPSRR